MSCIFRGLLLVAFFSIFYPALNTHAAEDAVASGDQDIHKMKEYVISDSRLPTIKEDVYKTAGKITIITQEDIRKMGANTVQDAVQHATGIFKFNNIGNAFEHSIDLRGFVGGNNNTSVFVDGVRMNRPDGSNAVNFDLIPLEMIYRIEVHPGGSAIFGKFALGGTINIVTKRERDKRFLTGEAAFGSFQRERYTINTGGPIGDFDYFANLTRETESGFRDNSGARISRFFGKIGYQPSRNTDIDVAYTYVKNYLEGAGTLPLSIAEISSEANFSPLDFSDRENNFIRANVKQVLPLGFTVSGNGFYQKLQEETFSTGQSGPPSTGKHGDTHSSGGVLQVSHESRPFGFQNDLLFGSEFSWNFFERVFFGGFTSQVKADEEVASIFFQDAIHLRQDVILKGGFRYDSDEFDYRDVLTPADSAKRTFNRLTPRASLIYLIRPKTSVYFSYSQNFRPPTIDELTDAAGVGFNENLKEVVSDNFEVGLKTALSTWGNFELAMFQSDVEGEILFTCTVCDGVTPNDSLSRNLESTRHRGFEATLKVRPIPLIDGEVNYSFTEAQFRTPFFLTPTRFVDMGDSLPQVPKNRLSILVNVYPLDGLTLSLNGLYVSTQFFAGDEENIHPRLPGYFVLNGRIAYQRPVPGGQLKIFLMLNNITNTEYFTLGRRSFRSSTSMTERFVMTEPGINTFGGLSYTFESFFQ